MYKSGKQKANGSVHSNENTATFILDPRRSDEKRVQKWKVESKRKCTRYQQLSSESTATFTLDPPRSDGKRSLRAVKFIEDVSLVEFVYLVYTRMPCESYRRRLRS